MSFPEGKNGGSVAAWQQTSLEFSPGFRLVFDIPRVFAWFSSGFCQLPLSS
jgi:hypothetical protein